MKATTVGAALMVMLFGVTSTAAQSLGSVSGRVVEQGTLRPLVGAQVSIPTLAQGSLTNADGRFLILNVPAGPATVRAQMIGYGAVEQSVTVAANGSATVNFELRQEALSLDAVVVTGTAGQARLREVGNSIEQINVEQTIVPTASGVEGLLQAQAPGVNITMSSGQVGSGATIRLRGNVSTSLSNQPLIYIDGIRVMSDPYNDVIPVGLGQQWGTFATPTPLQDINPSDIARIEIIKGAAATTLYGTEAAAGVIQIFTKRGGTGAPRFEAGIDQGVAMRNFHGMPRTLRGTPVESFPQSTSLSGGSYRYGYLDPWMQNAHRQTYTSSVRGGTQDVSYFVSGTFSDNDDIFVSGYEKVNSVRGNVGVRLSEALTIDWNSAYNSRDIRNVGCGDNFYGLCARSTYGILNLQAAQVDSLVYDPDYNTEIDRLVTGVTATFQPIPGFVNRLTFGYDQADNLGRITIPYGFSRRPEGMASMTSHQMEISTIDFSSTLPVNLTSAFGVDLSAGVQRVKQDSREVSAFTERFPGPGEVTLSSGAISLAREEREKVITGGVFGQALFKYLDRLFVTAGIRVDGNSAFGQDFGWQAYPKLSASYVLSDEAFWPESLGELKLRAAWGAAGRAPGAFDAVRTWDPTPWNEKTAFEPSNLGNPELGPERTAEMEFGFDGSTLDGRLTMIFTWYRQLTSDALLAVATAQSNGPWGTQLQNIGELENRGIELSLVGTVLQHRLATWDLGVNVSTNHSEVLDMGGIPETSTIAVGHPVPSVRGTLIENPDEIAEPIKTRNHRFGPAAPTLIVTPNMELQLPRGIVISARGEYQAGHWINDSATQWSLVEGNREQPVCFDAYALLEQDRYEELTAHERVWCTPRHFDSQAFKYPADYFKLREITVRMPVDWAVPMASSATLSLSAQNLYRWVNEDFLAYDPERSGSWSDLNSNVPQIWQMPAPPKLFSASLRVGF